MRQSDLIKILEDHGPMTATDIADLDGRGKYWIEKKRNIKRQLRALERQGMVCRLGTVQDRDGYSMIIWGLKP